MIKIAPSVLACDLSRLAQEVAAMEQAGADMIHLDVMDGHFVPNISFGAPVIKSLRPVGSIVFDTHLMISDPLAYLDDFASAGCDMLTFHIECVSDIAATLQGIKSRGMKAGLVLKPKTPAEAILPYLADIDMALVMTVEPGFGGQKFMPDMCAKISALRRAADEKGLSLDIQVDGGIDLTTAPIAVAHGANVLVAGSSLYGQPDYTQAIQKLRTCAQQAL